MFLDNIHESLMSQDEKLLKFKVDTHVASYLSTLCDRFLSTGDNIPPQQPIGNGQPSPENTARDKLEQHWREVIRNASDILSGNEDLKAKYLKKAVDEQVEKAKADQEFLKENSEAITAIDQKVPDGSMIHVDPYILQIRGSKLDFSRVLAAMMTEYFLPKFTLISKGKLKEAGMENWEESFWKAASNSGAKPDTSDTDFPVDADLWNSAREIFGVECNTLIIKTVEPLQDFNEKVHKYANATVSKLTMTLVDVVAPEPKQKAGALEVQGNNLRRYIELATEVEQVYQLLLKFCTDKYNMASSIVHGVATYYEQTQSNAKEQNQVASEMAALQF